jgi:hypothetical protein
MEPLSFLRLSCNDRDRMVHEICRQVAANLEGVWRIAPHDPDRSHWHEIADDAGHKLLVSIDYHTSKLTIRGIYPRNASLQNLGIIGYHDREPSIGANALKPAAKIARDIDRRLLPDYLMLYAAAEAKLAELDALERRKDEVIAELSQWLGEARKDGSDLCWYPSGAIYRATLYHSDTETRIELRDVRLTLEQARELLPIFSRMSADDAAKKAAEELSAF